MSKMNIKLHTAGSIIRKHRLAKKLTQAELAEIVGVSKSTIGKWETGVVTTIKQDMRSKLVKVLGINSLSLTGMAGEDEYILKIIAAISDFSEKELAELMSTIETIKSRRL